MPRGVRAGLIVRCLVWKMLDNREITLMCNHANQFLPFELVSRTGVTFAAAGVYLSLLVRPEGVSDPSELSGRGLTEAEVKEALEELRGRGLIGWRRL